MAEVKGRPVDVEIVTRSHALLSASSADRWLTCTPSARIEEELPDRGSSFASDGTAAHAFAELRLRYLLGQQTRQEYLAAYEATRMLHLAVVEEWEVADWEAINSYVRYVLDRADELKADIVIEARVDYSRYAEGGFGTSDALLVSETYGVVEAIDLKFGKGVPVSARDNSQAKLYTLGGFLGLDLAVQKKIKTFSWAIVQPRLNYVGTDELSAKEMKDWAENVVKPAAELAWAGKGKLAPSEKACRFCKAAPTCRARAAENVLIARRDFTKFMDKEGKFSVDLGETQMTMEEVGKILPNLDSWMQWARDVQAYALAQVRDYEQDIPGYKLVRGRSMRKWAEPDAIVAKELLALGVDEEKVYEPIPTERPVRSVAQMEKAMGKKDFTLLATPLVTQPPGTPALVPVSDPRDAINATAEAARLFKVEK